MLTQQQSTDFAEAWLSAWNSHDLDIIMHHYAEEIEFTSPFIVALNNDPKGTIRDKVALRGYFQRALQKYPELHFELDTVLTGVESVVLYYKSVNNTMSAEFMQLNEAGKVNKVCAHYLPIQ